MKKYLAFFIALIFVTIPSIAQDTEEEESTEESELLNVAIGSIASISAPASLVLKAVDLVIDNEKKKKEIIKDQASKIDTLEKASKALITKQNKLVSDFKGYLGSVKKSNQENRPEIEVILKVYEGTKDVQENIALINTIFDSRLVTVLKNTGDANTIWWVVNTFSSGVTRMWGNLEKIETKYDLSKMKDGSLKTATKDYIDALKKMRDDFKRSKYNELGDPTQTDVADNLKKWKNIVEKIGNSVDSPTGQFRLALNHTNSFRNRVISYNENYLNRIKALDGELTDYQKTLKEVKVDK